MPSGAGAGAPETEACGSSTVTRLTGVMPLGPASAWCMPDVGGHPGIKGFSSPGCGPDGASGARSCALASDNGAAHPPRAGRCCCCCCSILRRPYSNARHDVHVESARKAVPRTMTRRSFSQADPALLRRRVVVVEPLDDVPVSASPNLKLLMAQSEHPVTTSPLSGSIASEATPRL